MGDEQKEEGFKLAILLIVTIVWAVTFLYDASSPSFEVPTVVHGLMASVIGYFVGSRLKKK